MAVIIIYCSRQMTGSGRPFPESEQGKRIHDVGELLEKSKNHVLLPFNVSVKEQSKKYLLFSVSNEVRGL